jgi:hypothetical protein
MPAGLDGHPSPIRTVERDAVLDSVADRVCSVDRRRVLVGIDADQDRASPPSLTSWQPSSASEDGP